MPYPTVHIQLPAIGLVNVFISPLNYQMKMNIVFYYIILLFHLTASDHVKL